MYQSIRQLLVMSSIVALIVVGPSSVEAEVHGHGNYSEKEKAALKQFRTMIPDAMLYQYYMKEDDYLIRWIRDRDFDLEKANEKLRTSLKWRKDNRIDSVLQEDLSSILALCPFDLDGVDREQRPFMTASVGKCNIRKIVLQGNIGQVNRAIYWAAETCLAKLLEVRNRTGLGVRTGAFIADVGGFNLRQHSCPRCTGLALVPTLLDTYENHYPEYMEIGYFINVPRLAHGIIDLFLPLVSQRTRDLVRFYGHDKAEWQAEILKRISPDQLPPAFGGTKGTTRLRNDST